jgi:hypothetical protein
VLLCDSRDVFLQDDPFRFNHKGLNAAGATAAPENLNCLILVAEPIQINAYQINAGWIRTFFSDATLNAIGGQPVLCGGTILGDQASMEKVSD